eukprot:64365-Chlamydomonas_euryale.AAC.1
MPRGPNDLRDLRDVRDLSARCSFAFASWCLRLLQQGDRGGGGRQGGDGSARGGAGGATDSGCGTSGGAGGTAAAEVAGRLPPSLTAAALSALDAKGACESLGVSKMDAQLT